MQSEVPEKSQRNPTTCSHSFGSMQGAWAGYGLVFVHRWLALNQRFATGEDPAARDWVMAGALMERPQAVMVVRSPVCMGEAAWTLPVEHSQGAASVCSVPTEADPVFEQRPVGRHHCVVNLTRHRVVSPRR
ncbi:hypothetical protein GCM10017687_33410 [Streptomyces echinatus]